MSHEQQNIDSQAVKLHRLIDDFCDSSISSEQMLELNARLESDSVARQEYLNHICIEARLCSLFLNTDQATASQATKSQVGSESDSAIRLAGGAPPRKRDFRKLFTLAATLAAVALGSSVLTYKTATEGARLPKDQAVQARAVLGPVIARISGTRNCLWGADCVALGYGSSLLSGQVLDVATGVVEVTFASGARVVLEGPAKFRVPSAESAQLLAGRMSASVPPDSTEFSVSSPGFSIQGPGTQFGLIAGSDGLAEVHVFGGSVRPMLLDEQGRAVRRVDLEDHNAARFSHQTAEVTLISANPSGFVRSLASTMGPGGGLLAVEEFDYPVGPLAWQNGGFGWAGPWADIEADNESIASGVAQTNSVGGGSLSGHGVLSLGNHASLTGQENRIRRTLSTSIGGVFDAASLIENQDGLRLIGRENKSVYVSFLQQVSQASQADDNFYGFEMHRGDGNFNRVLCIGNGAEKSGYGVTSNFNNIVGDKCKLLGPENTGINFFVVRIDFGIDNLDRVTVYRNPVSLEDESRCQIAAKLSGNFAFDRISLANFLGNKNHSVDEVRLGTNFRAVTVERGQLEVPLALRRTTEEPAIPAKIAQKMDFSPFSIRIPIGTVCR